MWGRQSWEWGWLSCRPPAPLWAVLSLGGAGALMGAGDLWPRVRDGWGLQSRREEERVLRAWAGAARVSGAEGSRERGGRPETRVLGGL